MGGGRITSGQSDVMEHAPSVARTGRPTITRVFLGQDLLAYLVLALGAALAVGNVLAVVRPPEQTREGELSRAPLARSLGMALVGAIAFVWALASLLKG
jgi:hypothetical protein